MNFITDFFKGRHKPTDREIRRRGVNVTSDAVSVERDRQIAAATVELVAAREDAKRKRVEVLLAARVAREVRKAVDSAGQSFEVGIEQVARRIAGQGDD